MCNAVLWDETTAFIMNTLISISQIRENSWKDLIFSATDQVSRHMTIYMRSSAPITSDLLSSHFHLIHTLSSSRGSDFIDLLHSKLWLTPLGAVSAPARVSRIIVSFFRGDRPIIGSDELGRYCRLLVPFLWLWLVDNENFRGGNIRGIRVVWR